MCLGTGDIYMKPRVVDAVRAAELLSAVGNAKRLAILDILLDREMTVTSISKEVDLSQSALSQHLARLRHYGLVQTRRDRQMIYYSCKSRAVRSLINTIMEIERADGEIRMTKLASWAKALLPEGTAHKIEQDAAYRSE